ncbi:MAG: L,D-transpeptidase [Thermomicrobiales bacterium]
MLRTVRAQSFSRRLVLRLMPFLAVSVLDTGRTMPAQARGQKVILVSIGRQTMWAMKAGEVMLSSLVSTGRAGFDTPLGSYAILTKLPSQTMSGVIGGESYNVPDVPNVMYFTNAGHALHGTYWHNNFGTPMSHGCVNLPMDVAAWLYAWAPVGTPVQIVP